MGQARLRELSHAVSEDALCALRDRGTGRAAFAGALDRVATVLAVTMLAEEETRAVRVETPLGAASGERIARPPVLVPVLRAGLGMVDAFLRLVPEATVGHIGLWRDESTRRARRYLVRLPEFAPGESAILLDPMLATGGSAVSALRLLAEHGASRLRLACVIAAPEGLAAVGESGMDVEVTVAKVDDGLSDRAFIVPGLGDAGDRQFGVLGTDPDAAAADERTGGRGGETWPVT